MKAIKPAVLVLCLLFLQTLYAQQPSRREMQLLIRENFEFAQQQYLHMMTLTPKDKLPQSFEANNNKFIAYGRTWWCTGFYPGALWLIYEQTGNPLIKKEAERALDLIAPNQTYTGNHDLGFMMYCSFGNAYRITGDPQYKSILLQSAQSLATRYRPSIKAIQSWNSSKNFQCPVIIDNMMNLELLHWVSDNGGAGNYKDIAVIHANTTLRHHFRPDYSSYHVIDYDTVTGNVLHKKTWQGAADSSSWARGQAWALYGYTMMYRFTQNKNYLNQAHHIAGFILNHPRLPKDKIPYWDFDAPQLQGAPRDASAAAIIASALLELAKYSPKKEKKTYLRQATVMLQSLSSTTYRAKQGANGGFLLMHSTGALPFKSEVDVPLIYADYYFLEALKRYKDWYL